MLDRNPIATPDSKLAVFTKSLLDDCWNVYKLAAHSFRKTRLKGVDVHNYGTLRVPNPVHICRSYELQGIHPRIRKNEAGTVR